MKIHNQNLSTPSPALESTKTGKADSALNINKNNLDSKNISKNELRDSSRVDLSTQAQRMQRAKEIAGDQSIDEAKVARLQKLIDEGKYQVDPEKVADRLVDSHMDFSE